MRLISVQPINDARDLTIRDSELFGNAQIARSFLGIRLPQFLEPLADRPVRRLGLRPASIAALFCRALQSL
jgi:hypothetical protein